MGILETKGLGHKQGNKFVLQDIDWQVNPGERWVVFGQNGCGKTTLLSAVAGYRFFSHGEAALFGQKLTADNAVALRREVGFVSSSYFDNCFRYENALNIVLGGWFGGLCEQRQTPDAVVRQAKRLLTMLGLKHKGAYPYDLLSKGQRQAVLLARALIVPPKLLILDEPCTGLDVLLRNLFLNTLAEIAGQSDTAMIYVTHHSDEILPFFNKAMLLKKGRVYKQGDIEQVFNNNNLSEIFGQQTAVQWQNGRVWFDIAGKLPLQDDFANEIRKRGGA